MSKTSGYWVVDGRGSIVKHTKTKQSAKAEIKQLRREGYTGKFKIKG